LLNGLLSVVAPLPPPPLLLREEPSLCMLERESRDRPLDFSCSSLFGLELLDVFLFEPLREKMVFVDLPFLMPEKTLFDFLPSLDSIVCFFRTLQIVWVGEGFCVIDYL